MKNSIEEIPEITRSTIPEIPPDHPFDPREPENSPVVSMPMVYVDSDEKAEYRVLAWEMTEAEQLEAELNTFGKRDWWLTQVIQQEKQMLFVFSRRNNR